MSGITVKLPRSLPLCFVVITLCITLAGSMKRDTKTRDDDVQEGGCLSSHMTRAWRVMCCCYVTPTTSLPLTVQSTVPTDFPACLRFPLTGRFCRSAWITSPHVFVKLELARVAPLEPEQRLNFHRLTSAESYYGAVFDRNVTQETPMTSSSRLECDVIAEFVTWLRGFGGGKAVLIGGNHEFPVIRAVLRRCGLDVEARDAVKGFADYFRIAKDMLPTKESGNLKLETIAQNVLNITRDVHDPVDYVTMMKDVFDARHRCQTSLPYYTIPYYYKHKLFDDELAVEGSNLTPKARRRRLPSNLMSRNDQMDKARVLD